ncbi:MAG: DNA polymerase [Patescibacteria group bacterium]|nr:DNA polymerase [Patescibacteria group bacterium]
MRVFLIDANALIHRLYHALPNLGQSTNAIYGLVNLLLKFIQEYRPEYVYALYDRPEPTQRHLLFKEYKATRPKISDDLAQQINLSKEVFDVFNIRYIEKPGYEADDLIASLKRKFYLSVDEVFILTGDLDTLQLVDEKTKIMIMQKGISQVNIYDQKTVKDRFGVLPSQIVDYKALVGDASDNIIGISGVGEKTASQLLQKFGSLDEIIKAAQNGLLRKDLGSRILEEKERLFFNRELITLIDNIEIKVELEKYIGFDREKLVDFCHRYNFKSILNRLGVGESSLFRSKRSVETDSLSGACLIFSEGEYINVLAEEFRTNAIEDINLIKKTFQNTRPLFVFDLKNVIKKIIKDDPYFDKKIDFNEIYDLKLIFWLLNPNRRNFTFNEVILNYDQKTSWQEVANNYINKLKDFGIEKVYFDLELPLSPILARTENYGIKVDPDEIKNYRNLLLIKIKELEEKIYNLAGVRFKINSTKTLREILFNRLKIDPKKLSKTSKGQISTKEEDLLKIVNDHPIISCLIEYRKLSKLATTYTDSLLINFDPATKRVFPTFIQIGTNTGRIITEQPNLQNLPEEAEIKRAFIAEEGYVFVGADYSQLELRLLAHLSQDENLLSAFYQKIDIHSQTAKLVFGDDDPESRRKAKTINFGIAYGITPRGLADRLQISVSEASKLISRFFYFYPQVKKFNERMIDFAKTYGYVETIFGRKKFLPEISSSSYKIKSEAERMAINMPIQGLAADIFKKVIIEIDRHIFENKVQAHLVLAIHDELIFEVAKENKNEFKDLLKNTMENVIKLTIPLEVKLREGKNLAEI